MHGNSADFIQSIATGLGCYYLLLFAMNWIAALWLWRKGPVTYFKAFGLLPVTNVLVWMLAGMFFLTLAPFTMIGWVPTLPAGVKDLVNAASGPVTLSVGALVALGAMFVLRRFFVNPIVAWSGFNLSLLAMGLSMTDPSFAAIVTKPDNVPIVGLVFLLGFFTWLATYKAVQNDDRMAQGLPPLEKEADEKVLVWPDLVYTELICMIALTAFLLVWAIALQAPLEEPASSVKTPNPSKAPWYFLGLQEMLVYYDPWYAGVVLPSVVIFGLMAIPFLDFNKKGNGYFTIAERKFSYLVFQVGFLNLWVVLIVLGTFLRGPNWNFFGPFEPWNAHKVLAQNNVDLSQYFWVEWLGSSMPKAPEGSGAGTQFWYILEREAPGIIAVLAYFMVLPPFMATTKFFRGMFVKMGFLRFMLLSNLLLLMASLPLKMVLRWIWNLKYIISIPEYFLNF
ncbi:MAG TPA: hypothetical protein VMV10_12030 [Pirellulales bacterium]|nr:hypothetical protein [Pirellulales bacterium]